MNSWRRSSFMGLGGALPPTVKNLILINVGVYLLGLLFQSNWIIYLGLAPRLFWHGYIWQVFTYMFLHGGLMHLVFNMFVLWMFGTPLEWQWGPKRFLTYYFVCGVGAGLFNAVIEPNSVIPIIGASGAIYGLLLAFGLSFPNQLIFIYFLFPIRAKYFVIIVGGIELLMAFGQPHGPIANIAHLGGILTGLVYLKKDAWLLKLRQRSRRQHQDRPVRMIWNQEQEMERLQREVDDLLDKINREGLENLTRKEINRLKEASRKLREWERKQD